MWGEAGLFFNHRMLNFCLHINSNRTPRKVKDIQFLPFRLSECQSISIYPFCSLIPLLCVLVNVCLCVYVIKKNSDIGSVTSRPFK